MLIVAIKSYQFPFLVVKAHIRFGKEDYMVFKRGYLLNSPFLKLSIFSRTMYRY